MDKRRLGRTDLEIEPIVFGCNVLGWTLEEADAFRVLALSFRNLAVHSPGVLDGAVLRGRSSCRRRIGARSSMSSRGR